MCPDELGFLITLYSCVLLLSPLVIIVRKKLRFLWCLPTFCTENGLWHGVIFDEVVIIVCYVV